MPFVKTLQFEIGQLLVDEKDLNVDVVSILVKEVLEEVGDGLEGDVAADDDVTFTEISFVTAGVFRTLTENLHDLGNGNGEYAKTVT